jgi:hypothetical protein
LAATAAARTAWTGGVALAAGTDPFPTVPVLGVAAAAVVVALAHAAGSGWGRPHKERVGLLAVLPAVSVGLAALVTALAGLEHTAVPRGERRPAAGARLLLEGRAGVPPGVAGPLARLVDGGLDGGLAVLGLCVAVAARAYNALSSNKGAAARRA